MKIGILGAGSVGKKIAALANKAGHQVKIGLRDSAKSSTDNPWQYGTLAEASDFGEIVMIAIPYLACADVLPALGEVLAGKVVIDATNPLTPSWSPVLLGQENSAGEEIARLLPGSSIVKAFNTVFADIMLDSKIKRDGQSATVFVCSDDRASLALVSTFVESLGFAPVDVGPLCYSRYLEGMAHLNIQLAIGQSGGTNAAFLYHRAGS
jgi:8-hydroxy-5-deazaflavin:NADPH oxidoreductase